MAEIKKKTATNQQSSSNEVDGLEAVEKGSAYSLVGGVLTANSHYGSQCADFLRH